MAFGTDRWFNYLVFFLVIAVVDTCVPPSKRGGGGGGASRFIAEQVHRKTGVLHRPKTIARASVKGEHVVVGVMPTMHT